MDSLLQTPSLAVSLVFQPYVPGVMLIAAVFGLFVESIPGLTATMAAALLIPITFFYGCGARHCRDSHHGGDGDFCW